MVRLPFRALLAATLCGPALAARVQDPRVLELADRQLTITLPEAFADVAKKPTGGPKHAARWTAKLGDANVAIDLYLLPADDWGFSEPDDVTETALETVRDPKQGDPRFWYEATELVPGPFGWAAYGSIGWGDLHDGSGEAVTGSFYTLGGLLETEGYLLEAQTSPALPDEQEAVILDLLRKGVVYAGEARDPKWTDDEARARWTRDAPEATHKKYDKPIRTAHYIVLSNSSGSKSFAKKMEECHAAIQKTFPFDSIREQRLLPVLLFRTPDEYYEFYAKIADIPIESARRSKGHAWRDYYATWYEAPNDPVHVHEATHQIFANRLHLNGGGSWFQEGVAEYMESSKNERNAIATQVKKGRHVPLPEFVRIQSLLHSSAEDDPKGDAAGDNYKQAALLIEFLRESKWAKGHFEEFLRTVGRLPRNDGEAIERAVSSIYGCGLADLEERWVEYCKKR